MRHFPRAACGLLAAALVAGCSDDSTTGLSLEPQIVVDTVDLAVPTPQNAGLPTALDFTGGAGIIIGGRFPERVSDVGQWDLAVRARDGGIALVPPTALGYTSLAGITPAISGETFGSLARAPGPTSFLTDSAVVIREGSLYAARSRVISCAFGQAQEYAKIQPLSVDVAAGRVTLQIATNTQCGDPRLVPES